MLADLRSNAKGIEENDDLLPDLITKIINYSYRFLPKP
jgi:hypothetical protein